MLTAFRKAAALSRIAQAVSAALDLMFDNVSILLKGDGADGAFFVDEKGGVITAPANARVSTAQSKFGGSSLRFSGGQTFLPYRPEYQLASDYTVEFWMYPESVPTADAKLMMRHTSGVYPTYGVWYMATGKLRAAFGNGVNGGGSSYVAIDSPTAITLNKWLHVVQQVRNGQCELYLDGVLINSVPRPSLDSSTSLPLVVAENYYGFLDEVRITKGFARYLPGFTPPTAPMPIESIDPYWDRVAFLMHMDGAQGGTVFKDEKGHPVVSNGFYTSTSAKVFGDSSAYNNGATPGAYISALYTNGELDFGFEDFTVEIGFRTAANTVGSIVGNLQWSAGYNGGWRIYKYADGSVAFTGAAGNSIIRTPANVIPADTFVRIAVTRNGDAFRIFVNGVLQALQFVTTTLVTPTAYPKRLMVGGKLTDGGAVDENIVGYYDELRITKGLCRYTGNYTTSTKPFPNKGLDNHDTKLLLHFDGASPGDSSALPKPMTRTAALVTDAKFGTHALSLVGGINDNMQTTHADVVMGSSDFTLEWFMKSTQSIASNPNGQILFMENISGASYGGLIVSATGIHISTNGSTWQLTSAQLPLGFSPDNAWHHIAIVRHGTKVYLFMDGVKTRDVTLGSGALFPRHPGRFVVGDASGSYGSYNCKIDEVRLSKKALYIANFTPPSVPLL